MKPELNSLPERLRTSIWPIPVLITLLALGLSQIVIQIDRIPAFNHFSVKYLALSHSSFSTILTTIAGSVISVGGIVFSVSMVAMTLASGQFGPKVLREYLGNRAAKITLGFFIGTFIYCLVTLLSFRAHDSPGLSLMVGVGLALTSLLLFVHFIHHTAQSIQADRVVHDIAGQLRLDLYAFCRQSDAPGRQQGTASWRRLAAGKEPVSVCATSSGYIESIDYQGLVGIAAAAGGCIKLPLRAGQFVVAGQPLAWVYQGPEELDESAIRDQVLIARMRTPVQDPEFAITQLTQIAARALSPGINDPGTAITCIDWLTAALAEVVDRDLPRYCFADEEGPVRVIGHAVDFDGLFAACYVPLHQFARGNAPPTIRLLEALNQLAMLTRRKDRLQAISRLLHSIRKTALAETDIERDCSDLTTRMDRLARRLEALGIR